MGKPISIPPSKLGSLELGRGLAALAVVAHHAGQASDAFTSQHFGRWFGAGALGVDFFFVLSGFIIYHVHHRDPRSLNAAQRFLGKRLRRIYVPYLPIALTMIAAYTFFPGISQGNRDWGLFTSLTLLPSGSPPVLSVAWTLVFEMIFYLFFLVFFFTRHFWWLVSAWVTATAIFALYGLADIFNIAPINVILHPLTLEFVAGMIAAMLFSRLPPTAWAIPTLLGLGLAVAYYMTSDADRVFFGLALAPLVLGMALAESHFGYRLPAPALLLGAASYAIYLVHNPLQSLVARVFRDLDNWVLTFTACCLAGMAIGVAYHLLFERPVLKLLSSRSLWRAKNAA
tara:strand:+ start:85078 stop:86103 length:1026 start_codon:yes stop_codon:yes gene_type:complete